MARIRSIKPSFFRHRRLFLAEQETGLPLRVAFAGLWTVCDREGRFHWEPDEIKLDCLPYDDVDFSRVLDALATRGFIVRYASGGRDYGWVPGFTTHQVINNRESASALPAPPESVGNTEDLTRAARVDNASTTRHDPAQAEGKGREYGRGKESPPSPPKPDEPSTDWADDLPADQQAMVRVWRTVINASPDQLRTWVTGAGRGPHRDMIARWLEEIPADRLPDLVAGILDRCEDSEGRLTSGGKPIRDVWAFLNRVVPSEWAKAGAADDAALRRDAGIFTPPVPWEQRLRGFRQMGFWGDTWGPRPGERGCEVPADVLARVDAKEMPR